MSKLAPVRIGGLVMGVWFLGSSVGNYIGGRLAGFYEAWTLPSLFGAVTAFSVVAGVLLLLAARPPRAAGRCAAAARSSLTRADPPRAESRADVALDKYRDKRDFTQSPEPDGSTHRRSPGGRTPRSFCVQKHLASHLHYDLRLEHDGVLLSWAVPKGPSIDPATKRLAMHVEDHPIDYGDFEGVIPSGYGAGIVMLWDRGTWTPEVDDVDAALAKGDLKFTLDGYKLKGSWALVRTKGWGSSRAGDGRSWLLIKHRDDWAGPIDIAEFAPLSVKSEGDFADILADDDPAIWTSNRPAQGGDAGKLFQAIIARALALRAEREGATPPKDAERSKPARASKARAPQKVAKPAATKDRPTRTAPRELEPARPRRARRRPAARRRRGRAPHVRRAAQARDAERAGAEAAVSCSRCWLSTDHTAKAEAPAIVPRDLGVPERSRYQLDARRQRADLEWLLVLLRIAHQRFARRTAAVGDDDIHGPPDCLRYPRGGVGRGEARHAAALGEQVRDEDDRDP